MEEIHHFSRIQKAYDLINKEYVALKDTLFNDYLGKRMAEFNTAINTSHDVLKHFEIDMTKWNKEFNRLRKMVTWFNHMLEKKRSDEAFNKSIEQDNFEKQTHGQSLEEHQSRGLSNSMERRSEATYTKTFLGIRFCHKISYDFVRKCIKR